MLKSKQKKRVLQTALATLALLLTLPPSSSMSQSSSGVAYVNGQWFDGAGFRPQTIYVVDGLLTTQRPSQLSETVDLRGGFVIPPLGDAHQHIFNSRSSFASDSKRFLEAGVYYVMVQDALGEPAAEVLAQAGQRETVDVSYTWAPLIGSGHGLLDFFKSLGEQGEFGTARSLADLDTRAFFLVDNETDLSNKWNKLIASKADFIKVILAFSEEHEKRRDDKRFYTDAALNMARPGLSPRLLPLLVQRAHAAGKRVSVHVETANDFRVAVAAGADLIAHLPGWHVGPTAGFGDESLNHWLLTDEDARQAAQKKVGVITTISPKPFFDNAKLGEQFRRVQRENLARLKRHGVSIAIGADNDETMAHGEVRQLADLGVFDNRDLLRLLVQTTPQAIFPKRKVGCLQTDCEASFLVLEANPLQQLENLRRVKLRVKQGFPLSLAETAAAAQESAQPVRLGATHVAGSVYLIRADDQSLHDNVVASVGDDGILLVDTAYSDTETELRRVLGTLRAGPVKFIINSHYHHAGGNDAFAREATIIAHHNVRERMQRETSMYGAMKIGPWKRPALPRVTFNDTLQLYFNGEEIQVLHFPNVHTDGDAIVLFKGSKVVATGDFFVPLLGVCDLANGCNWTKYLEGVRRLLELIPKDAKLAPGHGPLSTYDDLKEFASMLEDVTNSVRAQISAGKTLDAIKAEGLPARWRAWGERGIAADFFLTNVYEGLTTPAK